MNKHDQPPFWSRALLYMRHTCRSLAGLLAFSAILAIAVAMWVPFSAPMPKFIWQAQEWVSSGRIAETFTPIGYPLLIAPAYRIGGIYGIIVLQAALQIGLVGICFFFLLQLRVSKSAAIVGSLPIALHPELLLSITRSWDVLLSTFLLVLFVLLLLRIQAGGAGPSVSSVCGIVFAVGVFCRPNYLLLVIAVFYVLSSGEKSQPAICPTFIAQRRTVRTSVSILIFTSSVVFTYCLLGTIGHGSPFFPQNGPYNLFAGNNPYSAAKFLTRFNAEISIDPAYRAHHPELGPSDPSPNYHDYALNSFYLHRSIDYAVHNPFAEMKLFGIKLFTFFRPDMRTDPVSHAVGVVKCLLALPVMLFLTLLVLPRRAPFDRVDRLLLIVYAAYILPFLLTNSDPRFRIPLDVLLVLHSVRFIGLYGGVASRMLHSDTFRVDNKKALATFSSGMLLNN